MAVTGPTKKEFVKKVLKVGGIALLMGLAAAVIVQKGRVHVADPLRFRTDLRLFKNKPLEKTPTPAEVQEGVELLDSRAPAASATGYEIHDDERDVPVVVGDGLAHGMTAAQKKIHAVKASVLNHGTRLLAQHVIPHIKKPRGKDPAAICKNFRTQIRKLEKENPDVHRHAMIVGHGILAGGGLGKRGKKAFSTVAKLAAVAGTLGAMYLARNHLQNGIHKAWEATPPGFKTKADQMAATIYEKAGDAHHAAQGMLRNATHAVHKVTRPNGTLADTVRGKMDDTLHTVGTLVRDGSHLISKVKL